VPVDASAAPPEAGALLDPPRRAGVLDPVDADHFRDEVRHHRAFLNVHETTWSPMTFSPRVFESLAAGTPVVTTPSKGIEDMLGEIVHVTSAPEQTRRAIEALTDPDARDHVAQRGIRKVLREHTYARRLDDVLTHIGLPRLGDRARLVTVITVSNRPEHLARCLENYARQTYERRELVFVMNARTFDTEEVAAALAAVPRARALYVESSATLAECLNEALLIADGDYFAKFDDDDHYAPEYLADQMLAFDYTDAAVIGKRTAFMHLEGSDETVLRCPGNEFSYVNLVFGATLLADRHRTEGIAFTPVVRGTDTLFLNDCRAAGLRVFSTDRFNFVVSRRADVNGHTWQVDDKELLERSEPVAPGLATDVAFV
jgi:hypothetical protein